MILDRKGVAQILAVMLGSTEGIEDRIRETWGDAEEFVVTATINPAPAPSPPSAPEHDPEAKG